MPDGSARPLPAPQQAAAPRRDGARLSAALSKVFAWLGRAPMVPAAVAMLVVALFVIRSPDPAASYRGLGPVATPGGDTTVVFRPDTGAAEVRRILAAAGAESVTGPTVAGAYVLAVGPARQAAALQRLRAEPAVLMAEPLATPDAR